MVLSRLCEIVGNYFPVARGTSAVPERVISADRILPQKPISALIAVDHEGKTWHFWSGLVFSTRCEREPNHLSSGRA
jgi:hypothetical protein